MGSRQPPPPKHQLWARKGATEAEAALMENAVLGRQSQSKKYWALREKQPGVGGGVKRQFLHLPAPSSACPTWMPQGGPRGEGTVRVGLGSRICL